MRQPVASQPEVSYHRGDPLSPFISMKESLWTPRSVVMLSAFS